MSLELVTRTKKDFGPFFFVTIFWLTFAIYYVTVLLLKEDKAMKQSKLVIKVYQACIDHDAQKQQELRQKEFAKIIKHKAAGKPFDTKWTLIQV